VLVATTRRGVRAISFGSTHAALGRSFRGKHPHARPAAGNPALNRLVNRVIRLVESPASPTGLPLDVHGTPFQKQVWNALRRIPAGTTSTYAGIARTIGRPNAVRAVAAACGDNPIAVAIPCHRVIGSRGALTGYRWGLHRKRTLLAREAAARR
jgi:AraC family transcriptional regulator of adaptative response/methylated-DNA-[protein]-cysteine methyltransferase